MDPTTTYPEMSKALNQSGRAIHFNMCEWGLDDPWKWGNPIAQSWRMGGDHTGIWSSTHDVIVSSAAIPASYTGVPYGWNDMDMLQTGCYEQCAHANGKQANMTASEYITEFSMWAISASPLQFTAPIMNCTNTRGGIQCHGWISDLQKKILLNKEVIAINQDITPQGTPIKSGDLSVWARKLSSGAVAVAFYNQNDNGALSLAVDFKDLGSPFAKATARDLWEHTDLGVFNGRYPQTGGVSVDPHAVHVVLLTPSK
jgi:alpha-galactosidase